MKRETRLHIPRPRSAGVLLTYKCVSACKHCMYACSPRWDADWLSPEDAETILSQLAETIHGGRPDSERIGVNEGIHFSGGEPFGNFDLLLQVTKLAKQMGFPSVFVETNAFWCTDEETTCEKLTALRNAGLDGILISANPFLREYVPFERTQRAARIARGVFGDNVIVYQPFFYDLFQRLGIRGTMTLEEYMRATGGGLGYAELFLNGRAPYKLAHLCKPFPVGHFYDLSCRRELIRDWHVHVDNYGNFIPGYCGGLSLGDARDLRVLCRGIDLEEMPVLRALLTDMRALCDLGKACGYTERKGYVSKCHLCVDVRRHLALLGEFKELAPRAFYERLED